jgi:hypothetical protein
VITGSRADPVMANWGNLFGPATLIDNLEEIT